MSDRAADVSTQTPSPWKQRGRIGPSLIVVLGSGHGRSFSEVSLKSELNQLSTWAFCFNSAMQSTQPLAIPAHCCARKNERRRQ